MAATQKRSLDPGLFFLMAGLLVGILYCIFIPYGAGFDEERHLVRIYYMSQYEFMPNFPGAQVHEDVFELSYQRRITQTPAFDMFNAENFGRRFSTFDKLRYGQKTQSIYSPVIFLPQALIGRLLWWKYDFPILPTIILQKIAGLLMYLAGAYAAIRMVPYGKWIFTALALSPSALYQATTLNADGFTTAVSFAFIGWVIAVYVNESAGIRPRSIWVLAGLAVLLGVAKPGAIILLPVLLILWKQPLPSKKWLVVLIGGVVLAVAANVGWWQLASQGTAFSGTGAQSVSSPSLLLADPLGFIKPLLLSMVLTFPDQVRGWVAAYGYGAGTIPGPVYFFSALFLFAALLTEPQRVKIPAWTRIFLVGTFIVCCTAIYSIAFAANYGTGGILALAKHGRYYIPFTPLLFLGIAGLFTGSESLQRQMRQFAVVAFMLVIGFYSFGIYATYYTYCGYGAYVGEGCTLPIYKNLEKEERTITVQNGERLNQTFTNQCGQLELVQVFINAIPESSAGSLRFALLDQEHQLLASRDFSVSEITAFDYINLPVQLPPGYSDKIFEIELEASNLQASDTFKLVVPTDIYPGELSTDGKITKYDLLIHYTCAGP